jgi:hypothetical protein
MVGFFSRAIARAASSEIEASCAREADAIARRAIALSTGLKPVGCMI